METKEKRTQVLAGLLALAGLLLVWTLATAGDLEPSGPPASTMKTLDEIYDAVTADVSQREGYFQHYEVAPYSNETFFTVPAGKQFVLMKLWFRNDMGDTSSLYLTVNDSLFIDASSFPFWADHVEDFPDRCITVNASETLKVVSENIYPSDATVVGYFYDVE